MRCSFLFKHIQSLCRSDSAVCCFYGLSCLVHCFLLCFVIFDCEVIFLVTSAGDKDGFLEKDLLLLYKRHSFRDGLCPSEIWDRDKFKIV